jgi:hypothetical protein
MRNKNKKVGLATAAGFFVDGAGRRAHGAWRGFRLNLRCTRALSVVEVNDDLRFRTEKLKIGMMNFSPNGATSLAWRKAL